MYLKAVFWFTGRLSDFSVFAYGPSKSLSQTGMMTNTHSINTILNMTCTILFKNTWSWWYPCYQYSLFTLQADTGVLFLIEFLFWVFSSNWLDFNHSSKSCDFEILLFAHHEAYLKANKQFVRHSVECTNSRRFTTCCLTRMPNTKKRF